MGPTHEVVPLEQEFGACSPDSDALRLAMNLKLVVGVMVERIRNDIDGWV